MREKEFLPLLRDKLGIEELNLMQRRMLDVSSENPGVILLSPTGSGKTLAFILPVLKLLKPASGRLQTMVIAPSRELVIQITEVFRAVAAGYKVTPLYGGHKVEDETNSLAGNPDVVVATPGRLLDHANRRNLDLGSVRILVLDEFDKSLELGFEDEMKRLIAKMKNVSRLILTSATDLPDLPDYLPVKKPAKISFLKENRNLRSRLRIHQVESDSRDKLNTLLALLRSIAPESGIERTIVFVNHRESAERVAEFLKKHDADVALYHGALDQKDREKSLALFLNGSKPILVATDLAARGLDISGVRNVVHYHQPLTEETYTHRNGRTARVDADGDVYIITGPDEDIASFIKTDDQRYPDSSARGTLRSNLKSLYLTAGKKEKISRGDLLGFLVKEGGLKPSEVGKIDVKDHFAIIAVETPDARSLASQLSQKKIKGSKQRFYAID